MIKVLKFVDDTAFLSDVDLVTVLRAKLDKGQTLDFEGVRGASAGFLNAMLDGFPPENLLDLVENMSPEIEQALADWVDRVSQGLKPAERQRVAEVALPKPPRAPAISRAPITDDRYTPTRLVQRLRESLRSYIESAYPLSDPTLIRARRILLETEANGHLLAQEPFIETTTRYTSWDGSYTSLGLPEHVGQFFQKMSENEARPILFPKMYSHQARAFQAFLSDKKDVVVATGTGSGKTECFLVPMLGTLYDEACKRPESFKEPAVRALILYPMNALVNDQLSRLRLLFGEEAVAAEFKRVSGGRFPRFGMYTGRTPYPGPRSGSRDSGRLAPLLESYLQMDPKIRERLRLAGRLPAKDLDAFYAGHLAKKKIQKSGKNAGKERNEFNWDKRFHTSADDRELLTRQEMVHGAGTNPGHAPDILVTNYSMLEYMLMRPFERPIFEETRKWLERDDAQLLLVLDEAHMYRGAKGAEVAFLLRRLRARLGIHNAPHKLRVIATSASLGSDVDALENVKRFAADLTGKTPDEFEPITGTREQPSPAAPASREIGDLFAAIDFEALNRALQPEALNEVLQPLFGALGDTPNQVDEESVLAALYRALDGQPFVNQLILEAANSARSVSDLSQRVFPDHPEPEKALQTLLTLTTLARLKADSPGLVPTRVHAIFRGLHGLFACINPRCSGRQSEPGEKALMGKLFRSPRTTCDACGCRVLELSSCRSCGTPYANAFAESGTLDSLDFLWGETEGNLVRLQLLPMQPRYQEHTRELLVHMKTGFVDKRLAYPTTEVRSFFIYEEDHKATPNFERCVMCQPTLRGRPRIFDFRTRGEQPFTALIEAQFSEQPPQKVEEGLPNHGRKVLVFSDGRQKAARLAPALEHSHARDLFRQVIALAAQAIVELDDDSPTWRLLDFLYPAVVWVCAKNGYDIFPSADEFEFKQHLHRVRGKTLRETFAMFNRSGLRPTQSFAEALYSELTDRYYSLQALGLAVVEANPFLDLFHDFPEIGLSQEGQQVIFGAWVRLHLERQSLKVPGAALRDLGEDYNRPVGIRSAVDSQVLPNRFMDYLEKVLDTAEHVKLVTEWLRSLLHTELCSFEGDLYYLQPYGLMLRLRIGTDEEMEPWFRCVDCGRIHPDSLAHVCPGCCGRLEDADADYLEARAGFYRMQVLRAFDPKALEPFGLSAEEHTAQLTKQQDGDTFNLVEEYELRFQDIRVKDQPPIDVLSCTTTMEVGIDIGALTGVALRNVPPHVANYQQRAGRAGRRGRSIASVITYAHGTSHDAHYFDHPADIISGDVRSPVVYVENQQVLVRHINAYLVQRFFHETVPGDTSTQAYKLFESLGTVAAFLSEEHPCSFKRLREWLSANASTLKTELRHWVPAHSFGLQEDIAVEMSIENSVSHLIAELERVLPLDLLARRESLSELELESLDRELSDELLQSLITRAVLPRYAFPTDVVAFWVAQLPRRGQPAGQRVFEYEPQRDLQIALTEYAPGRSLTINKYRYESAALYSPYEPTPEATLARARPYTACNACGYVSLETAAKEFAICPVCGSDELTHAEFIRPAGFSPDINEKPAIDRGQPGVFAGFTDRARLEAIDIDTWQKELFKGRLSTWNGSRELAVVNKGVGERGFQVCPDCGRAEPTYGPNYTNTKLTKKGAAVRHPNPQEYGITCNGYAIGPLFLGHTFVTDTLILRLKVDSPLRLQVEGVAGLLSRAARMALTSLVEAIALAASRELQIDEGELSGWWSPVLGKRSDEAQLYLYDLLPGGAGYARSLGEALEPVFDATERILDGCSCASSCYQCIRHYGNNFVHASLDRHLALALLRHLRTGAVPGVDMAEKSAALIGLRELLRVQGYVVEENVRVEDVVVPLIVNAATGPIWVDVHHPLVNPEQAPSDVVRAAEMAFQEILVLDSHTLIHDLPEALGRLQMGDGGGQ